MRFSVHYFSILEFTPIRLQLQASTRLLRLPCLKILLNPWRTRGLLSGMCHLGMAHEEDTPYMETDLGGTATGWPTT
jgi:hypothetical protein